MAKRKNLGVIVPLPTSMTRYGPDVRKMKEHLKWLSLMHVSGVWILGTTGDFMFQKFWDKVSVITEMVPAAKALGLTTWCGIWDTQTELSGLLARYAKESGVDNLFAMTPTFHKVSHEAMGDYYERLAEIAAKRALPLYLYDFPQLSANQIAFLVYERLVACCNGVIAGVKDSSGDMARIGELARRYGSRNFSVLAGTNKLIVEARKAGANAVVSSVANIVPESVYNAWQFYDEDAQELVTADAEILEKFGTSVAINTWLKRWGMAGDVCLPHSPLSDQKKEELFRYLLPQGTEENKQSR